VPVGERDGVYLQRNERALPRAFVVGRVDRAEGLEGALAWLGENDPAQAAVVDGGPPLAGSEGIRQVRIVRWTSNHIQVEAEGPGLLVLSEVYDPDWQAEVDGRAVELVRTDGILRGVYLEVGLHQVKLAYWPAGLGIGCGVTAAGWACVMILWAVGRKARDPD
jgi:hypothetical protein